MTNETVIADGFGRTFPYLRLSLTDVCNFSCSYCLPDGYQKNSGCDGFLAHDELIRLARAFAGLGTWKIRLTGGEPTVRKDFLDIASSINDIKGVRKLALTTNGYKLPQRAQSFYDAGIRALNISIDSLNPEQFKSITGHDRLHEALDGIDAALAAGIKSVKVNVVLLKGLNDGELMDFMRFVEDKPISLRFIELMQTRDNKDYFDAHHLSGTFVTEKLLEQGWHIRPRAKGAGPAVEFGHEQSNGTIGLIAPYSKDFCKSCNRLRTSAKGDLHLCLFGEGGYSLRDLLQSDDQLEELQEKITGLMNYKRSAHFLHEGNSGVRQHLASIGG